MNLLLSKSNVTSDPHVRDATFSTPALLRPFEWGADIVLHSLTKYLNGHSDVIGGALIIKDPALGDKLRWLQNAVGAVLSPFDSFLALRGLRTLGLRMQRHSESALHIAGWLAEQPEVENVLYPGHPSHPQHALAKRLLPHGSGPMLSFEVAGSVEETEAVLDRLDEDQLARLTEGVQLDDGVARCQTVEDGGGDGAHVERIDEQGGVAGDFRQ